MKNTFTIEIAVDQQGGEQFAAWLNAQGHRAKVGKSTGSSIDGEPTTGTEASGMMNTLWEKYCDAA